nr:hypothetical protein [uncultured Faecalimonas sp.]
MTDRSVQIQKLEQIGICVSEGVEQYGEESYFQELEQFVRGQEFLRLGQAVTRGQWPAAMMAMRRIGQTMDRLKMKSMKKFLPQLQNAFARKNAAQAKNVLALLTQRRVQILRVLSEEQNPADTAGA